MPSGSASQAEDIDHGRRAEILEAAFEVAKRRGLVGLTVRRVAAAAGMSHGLIHHYFTNKATLLLGLLDWLLETMEHPIPDSIDPEQPRNLTQAIEEAVERALRNRERIDLYFDFWVMGQHHPRIRARFRQELARYRRRFVEFAATAEPGSYARRRTSAQSLAALAVAITHGCSVQVAVDPAGFDVEGLRHALRALFEPLETMRALESGQQNAHDCGRPEQR
jgi:TetR/AcrR family transcriptional repressor of bet genes